MNTSACVHLVTLRLLGIARRDKVLGKRGENVTLIVVPIGKYSTIGKSNHIPAKKDFGKRRVATITPKE